MTCTAGEYSGLPRFVFMLKLIQRGMTVDARAVIDASGKNGLECSGTVFGAMARDYGIREKNR
jgi:hypothetical protein